MIIMKKLLADTNSNVVMNAHSILKSHKIYSEVKTLKNKSNMGIGRDSFIAAKSNMSYSAMSSDISYSYLLYVARWNYEKANKILTSVDINLK